MKLSLLLLVGLLTCLAGADRFDAYVQSKMADEKIPGLQFVVVYKGKVAMSRAYGFSDLDSKKPVTKDTEFEIASTSKPFIATAVMMLVEQGKVDVEQPIGKYIADMPLAWSSVPVRNLLSHTSGIPEFRGGEYYFKHRMEETPFTDIVKNTPAELDFDAGDHFAYSNTNYLLLGKLIESVTGKPYTDFLQTQIFDPLGMTATGFVGKKDHAQGYNSLRKARDSSLAWAGPGAGIVSTAEDVAKFDGALDSAKLIKNSTQIKMLQPTFTKLENMDYGFGWQMEKVGASVIALHSGMMNGFSSMYIRLLNERISVIVLTNGGDIDGNTITRGILGLYFPEMDPQLLTPIVDDNPVTTKAHTKILLGIMNGVPDMDAFSDDYKAHISEEKLQAMGAELARGGRIKPLQLVKRGKKGAFDLSAYLLTQGQTQLIVTFLVDDKGKVAGLTIAAP